jgi:hypothetical protein
MIKAAGQSHGRMLSSTRLEDKASHGDIYNIITGWGTTKAKTVPNSTDHVYICTKLCVVGKAGKYHSRKGCYGAEIPVSLAEARFFEKSACVVCSSRESK